MLHLIKCGYKENLVVCTNETDTGKSNWQPSLARFAQEFSVQIVSLDEIKQNENLLFISLEFDRLIKPGNFKSSRLYNIHFSALPAYKGMFTSALPIIRGETKSGVTLHEIDHGIDTGPIVAQQIFELPNDFTARDLYHRYLQEGLKLFKDKFETLMSVIKPVSKPQCSHDSTYFSRDSVDYSNVELNLKDTAEGIVRQLRAFSFREYQTPQIAGIEIGSWRILSERSVISPGQIKRIDPDTLIVSTIDYQLELKRDCSWDWFLVSPLTDRSVPTRNDLKLINIRDAQGWTPLIRAAYRGDLALCEILLNQGAKPNLGNLNGTTPLMYAYSSPDRISGKAIADLLINYGADPNRCDRFGKSLTYYHEIS